MAEVLAAASAAATIVQLVDFGAKILHRLEEFHSKLDDVPASFQHIRSQLPLLLETLKCTQRDIDAGVVKSEKELLPVINGCKTQIQSLHSILDKELPSPTDSRAKKSKKAIISVFKDGKVDKITSTLGNYVQTLTFYHSAVRSTLNPVKDETLVKIRQWLSAPDPSTNFHKAIRLRQPDTGLWFRDSDQFAAWKTNPSSSIWLHGIPGCGKTVLSSTIIESVQQYCDNDPGKVAAYFYFDFTDSRKQQTELMIRSLVSQLSQHCIHIPSALDSLFKSCRKGGSQPSKDALLDVLRRMCSEFPATYILLDALDECTNRDELMATVETIVSWQLESLHILVTSRKERDIELSLGDIIKLSDTISLQSSIVDKDIQRYVSHRLSADRNLRKWQKDPDICNEIVTALREGANGMHVHRLFGHQKCAWLTVQRFRWAVCQLDTLGKCLNRKTLRKTINGLPPTLDRTYERILCEIDENHSIYALRILQWLAFSERPLSLEEVAEVVAIDPQRRPALDRDDILEDPLDVLTICSTLVTLSTVSEVDDSESDGSERDNSGLDKDDLDIESPTQFLVFAHYSVKEYLISERICGSLARKYALQERISNTFITNCCLGYLLQFQSVEFLDEKTVRAHKLARYSAEFWTAHARLSNSDTTQLLIMELFSRRDGAYLNWIRIYDVDINPYKSYKRKLTADIPPPLYYASLENITKSVQSLIQDGYANVNAQGGEYGNALQAAAVHGFQEIVKLLLDAGADINAQGGEYGNALQAAAANGSQEIVKLLLDAGADINAQGGWYGNALQAAAANGFQNIVKLLLNVGADINAQGGWYGNALQAAAVNGSQEIVKLLLDAGADINAQGGWYGNALQVAAARGFQEIVKLLLDTGADINAQRGWYGNALQAAAANGSQEIVKLLLDAGADINAQRGWYGNALQAAAANGSQKIVKLLLNAGADINAQGGRYGNALGAADTEAVKKLLLDAGAI